MSWPTSEQFDLAHRHGTEYALQERANGATEPRESPLSEEWAGDVGIAEVSANVGFTRPVAEEEHHEWVDGRDELANAWERGYNDAWAHSIESKTT